MTRMFSTTVAAVVAVTSVASAGDPLVRVSDRFSDAGAEEVPDFRRHVVPLLGKLGCNGRACHGSFQGQGGFRLSLFGYDFKMDHEGLSERLDTDSPADSYALHKPTLQEPHEGGRRMKVDSWEYHVFLKWIEGGAKNVDTETMPDLVGVDVEPNEIVFAQKGEQIQLRAVAHWSDGSAEDVTPLCRFQTNSGQVAEISRDGMVTAAEPGDTHVVVFYDTAVVPIPVMRPVSDRVGPNYPESETPTVIDQLVVNKLKKLGIVQSDLCSDAEFLRRVSLDMTGSLPTVAEVEAFLNDSSQDKRARKIDELLERPGYAAWWAQKLCDWTGNSGDQLNNIIIGNNRDRASQDWYDWVHRRVADNMPYDDLMEGLVMAVSRKPGESYREYCETMSKLYGKKSDMSYADRPHMPHFWARQNFRTKEDRAIAFAYTFLGTRIQCAQCHKHPFDEWTQDDFNQFTTFFTGTIAGRNGQSSPESRKEYDEIISKLDIDGLRGGQLNRKLGELARKGMVVPHPEVYSRAPAKPKPLSNDPKRRKQQQAQRRRNRNTVATSGTLLGGEKLDLTEYTDIRQPLMDWLRSRESRFAKAFVNRVWAGYFNRGIVEPPDDLSLANPPCNAELLDWLTEQFVASDFDMKWLHRTIANSRTYQVSWQPNETNGLDDRNFSRFVPRRLPAEVAYDALVMAVSSDDQAGKLQSELNGRAIAYAPAGRRSAARGDLGYAMRIFGRSIRESNCDCDRSEEASLLQTVFFRNDTQVLAMLDNPKSGWLAQVAEESGVRFVPKATRSSNTRRPGNWKQLVVNYQKRLDQLKKAGRNDQIKQQKRKLKEYLSRWNVSEKELAGILNPEQLADGETTAVASIDADSVVRQAYLRTLNRLPRKDEMQLAKNYVSDAEGVDGVRDLLWALINTKEFIVNH